MNDIKPFRLKIRIQNNRLIRLREDLGLTQAECSRQINIKQTTLSAFENLRDTAWHCVRHEWNQSAVKIAAFHGVSPETIWPDEIREVRARVLTLESSARELVNLPSVELDRRELKATLAEAMMLLSIQEQRIIEMLSDGKTLTDVGKDESLSRERVRQIAMTASRKMIHPKLLRTNNTEPDVDVVRAAIELRDNFR
jgi:DNA-binding XRE family transcriptional regulator